MTHLDADYLAAHFRKRLIKANKFLIARLDDSKEAKDSYTRVNCKGYGRVRVFKEYSLYLEHSVFPDRPLRPNFRGYLPMSTVRSQVFQLSACNWRCWYCFVDDNRLSADLRTAKYFTAEELLKLYLSEPNRCDILDLSGGQPDLTPEWTLQMVNECEKADLIGNIHIWIDDNLSNFFLFEYLKRSEIEWLAGIPNLSRMGCFKGFDELSFSFTTGAHPSQFNRQFEVAKRLHSAGFRMYYYVTFATPIIDGLKEKMCLFVDKMQSVHRYLPLWTTPLRVHNFSVTEDRLNTDRSNSISNQHLVFRIWDEEIRRRYPAELLKLRPDEIL